MPEERRFFCTSDGAHLHFEDQGQGRCLMLVPGFLCTTRFFCRNVEQLSKRYRVITIDPRGQGLSSKTLTGNTLQRHAMDIAELAEHLDLTNFVLLGWSLAASTAISYAAELDPGRLAGVILVDGSLYPLSGEAWNRHRARGGNIDHWLDTYLPLYEQPNQFYDAFFRRMSAKGISDQDKVWMIHEFRKTPPWIALSIHGDFCHTDNVSRLPQVKVPIALFGGASVSYGLDMLYEYARHTALPAQIYPFYEGGHLLFYYEAEKFNRAVAEFIDSLSR